MNQSAVFDIYGHLTFENCTFKGIDEIHYTQFTFHLHRSKDGFKQIESLPTEPKKILKLIQCKTHYRVQIYFIIIEFAVNIEIIKSDLELTGLKFSIGNETAYTQGETQSFTFVNVTIVGCKYQYGTIWIKTFTPKSAALIQVLDTIMNYSGIFEYKPRFGSSGYIIDNCTFTNITNYSLKSFGSQHVRITNSKFIIEEDDSYCPEGGCAISVETTGEQSKILNKIFNQSCQSLFDCNIVHVDNSEFVGSTGIFPGGVMWVEHIKLKITNSVFRLTDHSTPPQTGRIIFLQYVYSVYTDNVTFDARKLTGVNRISIMSMMVIKKKTFNDAEILCPQGMMAKETVNDENNFQHYTCLPACSYGEYTYQSGTMIISGKSSRWLSTSLKIQNAPPFCKVCPVRANCREKVSPLPNYWGYVENNTVNMFRCPNGYCCQDSGNCNSLDSCNRNRSGILCGSCDEKLTESLISENCVSIEGCNSRLIIGL